MIKLVCVLVALIVVLSACGEEKEKTKGTAQSVPASVVTDAELQPGKVLALDAADLKTRMESGGEGGFEHNSPDKKELDVGTCFKSKFESLKLRAKDSTITLAGVIDYGECFESGYKEIDGYKNADFSAYKAVVKTKIALFLNCEGVNLDKYDGKAFDELNSLDECQGAKTMRVWTESSSLTSISGTIRDVDVDGEKKDYVIEEESTAVNATRSETGDVCVAEVANGVMTWRDGCVSISKSLKTKARQGFTGQVETEKDLGEAIYQKLTYVGLTAKADSKSLWFTGGRMDVTLNDWSGTVTYSSATAEPDFSMKKGSETVTGKVKADKLDLAARLLSSED